MPVSARQPNQTDFRRSTISNRFSWIRARTSWATSRAKKTLEFAMSAARELNHSYVGTEHLLLGLVREGEGIAAGVLESLGVNLDKVRHEVIRVLSQSSSAGPSAQETKRASKTPTVDQLGNLITNGGH